MSRSIDYYLSIASPWAYIGHKPFMDIARRHGLSVNHKPVFLGRVFAETGGLPVNQRHPARQRYRLVDLQRWREKRGLAFNLKPKHWPFDATLADRFVVGDRHGGPGPGPLPAPGLSRRLGGGAQPRRRARHRRTGRTGGPRLELPVDGGAGKRDGSLLRAKT